MGYRILILLLVLGLSAAQQGQTECRVCPERCLSFPREDDGCQICICDGVAKSDCELKTCQAGCRKELDADGCNECICDPICPAVQECPEVCEQKLDGDACIICDCGDNNNVCDAVPACPKGCIEMRTDTKCFSCNCTVPEEPFSGPEEPSGNGGFGVQPFRGPEEPSGNGGFGGRPFRGRPNGGNPFGGNPFGGNPFGGNPFGGNSFGGGNDNRRRPIAPTQNRPFGGFPNQPFGGPPNRPSLFNVPSGAQTSRCPAVQCPSNCRMTMDEDGCRQCLCGEDAMICPGVSLCFGRCLTTDPETNCCQCTCTEETAAAVSEGGVFGATLVFTRNGVTAIISPGFGFLGSRRQGSIPGGRPGQRPGPRPEQNPFFPNGNDAEGFPPQGPGIQNPINTDDINPFNPNFPNPANPNENGNNPPIMNPVDPIPLVPDDINPFNPNFPNPVNPNENGNNPPIMNPVDPIPLVPMNPDTDPNVNNNNPTNTEPVIPGAVDPQSPPDEACPNVEEVTCGGGCEPRAGPDGCPVCECGLLRRRTRPIIIVDENVPPTVNANADALANGDAAIIPAANGDAAIIPAANGDPENEEPLIPNTVDTDAVEMPLL